jgi:hypothetical protein
MEKMSAAEYRNISGNTQKTKKYRNNPITTPDGWFQSVGEYWRWRVLKLLERKGFISNLKRQVSYRLTNKKPGQLSVFWRPDFEYAENGILTVEDYKSPVTAKISAFRNKVKMFQQVYPNIRVLISSRDGVEVYR